jgi:hypothetical protein
MHTTSTLTPVEQQAVVDSVTAGMNSYLAALAAVDTEQVLGHYVDSPEFRLTIVAEVSRACAGAGGAQHMRSVQFRARDD